LPTGFTLPQLILELPRLACGLMSLITQWKAVHENTLPHQISGCPCFGCFVVLLFCCFVDVLVLL
jgi:hypothetical protein